MSPAADAPPPSRAQFLLLGLLATLMLVPVTLPVPVLRGLVQERFGVSDLQTSVFMSINMVGAFLAAPLAGVLADRYGRRKLWIVLALALDAACFRALTLDLPFWAFLAIRFVEGCAHIAALSLLLSLAAAAARRVGHGRSMGIVGAGITLGVAVGAPVGGQLGRRFGDLAPLEVGSTLLVATAVLVALALRPVEAPSARSTLGSILRSAREHRALLVPLAFAFVDRFTVGFFTTTFPLYLKRIHELPPDRIGMLLGLFLGPFFLLSYPCGRLSERVSRAKLVAGGSLCYGAGVMTVGLWAVDTLPWVMVTLGVLSAVMFVPSLIMTTELAPPEIKSTALGGFNAAGSLGFIVGPLVGGFVSQQVAAWSDWPTGYAAAFGVAGLGEIVCVAVTLPFLIRLVRSGRTA